MTVIKVENLSKKYIIRHQQPERCIALRDVMASGVKRMFNRGFVQPFKRFANSTLNSQHTKSSTLFAMSLSRLREATESASLAETAQGNQHC